jgi:hypothetical protein
MTFISMVVHYFQVRQIALHLSIIYLFTYYIIFIEAVTSRDHAGWSGIRIIIEYWIGKNEGNVAVG